MNYLKLSFEVNSLYTSLDKKDLYSCFKKIEKHKFRTYWYNNYEFTLLKQLKIKKENDKELLYQVKLFKLLDCITLYNIFNSNCYGFFTHTINKYLLTKNYLYHFDIDKYYEFIELLLLDLKIIDINLYYKGLVILHNEFKKILDYDSTNDTINLKLLKETSKNWIKKHELDFNYLIENIYFNDENIKTYNETYAAKYQKYSILYINEYSQSYLKNLFDYWYK